MSIGAFAHFGHERYDDFFARCFAILPDDGVMLLHTITGLHPQEMIDRGIPLSFDFARFVKFMVTEIFPGGRLPSIPVVEELATAAGFAISRVQSLQLHYALLAHARNAGVSQFRSCPPPPRPPGWPRQSGRIARAGCGPTSWRGWGPARSSSHWRWPTRPSPTCPSKWACTPASSRWWCTRSSVAPESPVSVPRQPSRRSPPRQCWPGASSSARTTNAMT
ncbi:hypothetical protein MHPYR_40059 [uncultured Mycobacterium sp.]|uniref:Uncharacterized protein n=1 Tax=uncultured Mycobacterium sp. TaxID=171292 RepID=A0A1Y5PEC6_9MYCO|nr:hypothetical protein MHPYR_40059 [uncultured Mycobacterium sp.]